MLMLEPTARPKILVVDDDCAILELVTTRLMLDNYNVFTARDGREGLERLKSLRPEGLVLDLNMPVRDGFSVLEELGKMGASRTPTLVLTARHAAADVQRALRLGARDYLAKPFTSSQLRTRVARLVRARGEAPDARVGIRG